MPRASCLSPVFREEYEEGGEELEEKEARLEELRNRLEQSGGTPPAAPEISTSCAEAVLAGPTLDFPEATDARVEDETAEVEVTGTGDEVAIVELVDEEGEWRVENVTPSGE